MYLLVEPPEGEQCDEIKVIILVIFDSFVGEKIQSYCFLFPFKKCMLGSYSIVLYVVALVLS